MENLTCISCNKVKSNISEENARCNDCNIINGLYHNIIIAKSALELNMTTEQFENAYLDNDSYTGLYIKNLNIITEYDVLFLLKKQHEYQVI